MFDLNTVDISTIVFTSLTSAVISGVVVYLIQKSIENSFIKKMEEFRASIQYSLFEQQTKFTKNYQKSTETILIFHQQLVVLRSDFDSYINLYKKIEETKKSSKNNILLNEQLDKLYKDWSDLHQLKDKNSIHLTQELSMKISELTTKVNLFLLYLSSTQISKKAPEIIQPFVGINKILKIDMSESAFQNTNELHQQIKTNIDQLVNELERLYREITT